MSFGLNESFSLRILPVSIVPLHGYNELLTENCAIICRLMELLLYMKGHDLPMCNGWKTDLQIGSWRIHEKGVTFQRESTDYEGTHGNNKNIPSLLIEWAVDFSILLHTHIYIYIYIYIYINNNVRRKQFECLVFGVKMCDVVNIQITCW